MYKMNKRFINNAKRTKNLWFKCCILYLSNRNQIRSKNKLLIKINSQELLHPNPGHLLVLSSKMLHPRLLNGNPDNMLLFVPPTLLVVSKRYFRKSRLAFASHVLKRPFRFHVIRIVSHYVLLAYWVWCLVIALGEPTM